MKGWFGFIKMCRAGFLACFRCKQFKTFDSGTGEREMGSGIIQHAPSREEGS